MRDILMIAHFTQVPGEKGNGRIHDLACMLAAGPDVKVEVVTSDFSHREKKPRRLVRTAELPYTLTMLHEPGYRRNVSLARLHSHRLFGRQLRKYLGRRGRADVVYCAVPSLDAAAAAADYARTRRIRLVVDVLDLWPEAFRMALHMPVLAPLLFYPMRRRAERIYRTADEIVGASGSYVRRALRANPRLSAGHSVYLGTDLARFDRFAAANAVQKPPGEFWLAYDGNLGYSYDLACVLHALEIAKESGGSDIRLIAMGDGPQRERLEACARRGGIPAVFTGRLEYAKMAGLLRACDAAVNPIRAGSAASVVNKAADYAAAGLPVLNTQECVEYRLLLEGYGAGLNCANSDPADLAAKLMRLYRDEGLRHAMAAGSRRLARDCFDRAATYPEIVRLLRKDG